MLWASYELTVLAYEPVIGERQLDLSVPCWVFFFAQCFSHGQGVMELIFLNIFFIAMTKIFPGML